MGSRRIWEFVIAHVPSLDSSLNPTGDTMEMMRAVLDSNFLPATHVVIITIGYSTTLLAGFWHCPWQFSCLFFPVFGGTAKYGPKLMSSEKDGQRILGAMIYGLPASPSSSVWWARFWAEFGRTNHGGGSGGWDAKENGALLIVIWNAILLHARCQESQK